jgi:MHS family alpha-ketoglutarate permease-like MFS transporter
MLFFGISGVLLTVPLMTLLGGASNPVVAFLLLAVAMIFVSGYTALSAIVKAEMFPTKVRALGVGLPHALVAAVFGGTSEPVALALKQAGNESLFFWYVTGLCLLTTIAAFFVKEPSARSTLEEPLTPRASEATPRPKVAAGEGAAQEH